MWKKILIAEDDKEVYEMFQIKLEKEWFDVSIVENWFDAITTAVDEKPDVILLDIMMPNMDGFKTLETLRQQTSLDTKILIFSNLKTNQHIQEAKELWADEYMVKADYTPAQVCQKIVEVLGLNEESKNNDASNKQLKDWNGNSLVHKCPHCWEELNITIN